MLRAPLVPALEARAESLNGAEGGGLGVDRGGSYVDGCHYAVEFHSFVGCLLLKSVVLSDWEGRGFRGVMIVGRVLGWYHG